MWPRFKRRLSANRCKARENNHRKRNRVSLVSSRGICRSASRPPPLDGLAHGCLLALVRRDRLCHGGPGGVGGYGDWAFGSPVKGPGQRANPRTQVTAGCASLRLRGRAETRMPRPWGVYGE